MKKSLLASSLLLLLTNSPSYANVVNICDGSPANPCIVQDTKNNASKIKKWRTAEMIRQSYKGNTAGLKNLWVSASSAPNKQIFKNIEKEIDVATNGKYRKIIDLDLREETHAYLNGNPISLTTTDNWINHGKSHDTVIADEQQWLHSLATQTEIENVLSDKKFHRAHYNEGKTITIQTIETEQNIVEKLGFEYQRLTVSDHLRPADVEVDRFVQLVRQTSDKAWLHMHCRAGNGRSTTFLAMYDMLKNADTVAFNDIIKRQASVEPFYDLADVHRKKDDMVKYYQERYDFLRNFYYFAMDVRNGYEGSWSNWMQSH